MGIVGDFLEFILDRRFGEEADKTIDSDREKFLLNKIKEHEDAISELHKRIKRLEKRTFLP